MARIRAAVDARCGARPLGTRRRIPLLAQQRLQLRPAATRRAAHTPAALRHKLARAVGLAKARLRHGLWAGLPCRNEGADILILARTDARQAVSLDEALWRAQVRKGRAGRLALRWGGAERVACLPG